jgi:hypothetical protein
MFKRNTDSKTNMHFKFIHNCSNTYFMLKQLGFSIAYEQSWKPASLLFQEKKTSVVGHNTR